MRQAFAHHWASEEAVGALRNLAASPLCAAAILRGDGEHGGIQTLIDIVRQGEQERDCDLLDESVGALLNLGLCRPCVPRQELCCCLI